jgi:hypothetical protein
VGLSVNYEQPLYSLEGEGVGGGINLGYQMTQILLISATQKTRFSTTLLK